MGRLTISQLLGGALVVVLSLGLVGCRTVVYRHTVEVLISDPTRRLGPPPHDVSVFDKRMGSTGEWARKTMGPTSDSAPYKVPYSTTSVASFLGSRRPKQVELALAVPSLEARGFFDLTVAPRSGKTGRQQAAFVSYGDYFPAAQAPKVDVQYTATAQPNGWHLVLRLVVPPAARSPSGAAPGP